ncbi:MAG: protein-tyrosine-phosphatase [Acetatifactor sp.]|nr:protein-tyrosine-phosphatase [Acetatifactor sp.]
MKKTAECIVDVHCHILPGIDDGSKDMEETAQMLRIAYEEGIRYIIATPHYKKGRRNASPEKVRELIDVLQEEADTNHIPITIFQGNEIFYFDEFDEAIAGDRAAVMCGGEYVLVEFSPKDQYRYIRNAVDSVMGAGYRPIVAHVERYECMTEHIEYVEDLKAVGAEIQVNAASITGETGHKIKKFTHRLLKSGLVDYIGTDAHGADKRSPRIAKCEKLLYKKFDADYVDAILGRNAMERLIAPNK